MESNSCNNKNSTNSNNGNNTINNYWKFCLDNIKCSCINDKLSSYSCKYGILYHLIELLDRYDTFNDVYLIGK